MDDFFDFLIARNKWSLKTFGEGQRTEGICRHIESELDEIRETPNDLMEWVDVILLALDGAFRAGHSPYKVLSAIYKKHQINTERNWSDTVSQDAPTYHRKD